MRLKSNSEKTFGSNCHSSRAGLSSSVRMRVGMYCSDPGIGSDMGVFFGLFSQRDMCGMNGVTNVEMRRLLMHAIYPRSNPAHSSGPLGGQALLHSYADSIRALSTSTYLNQSCSLALPFNLDLLVVVVSFGSGVICLLTVSLQSALYVSGSGQLTLKLLDPLLSQFTVLTT